MYCPYCNSYSCYHVLHGLQSTAGLQQMSSNQLMGRVQDTQRAITIEEFYAAQNNGVAPKKTKQPTYLTNKQLLLLR
jgi:hypothetical protein